MNKILSKTQITAAIDKYLNSHDPIGTMLTMQPWENRPSDICYSIEIDLRDASIQTRKFRISETREDENCFFPIITQSEINLNESAVDYSSDYSAFLCEMNTVISENAMRDIATAKERLDDTYYKKGV